MTDFLKSYLTVTTDGAVFSNVIPSKGDNYLTIETTPDISREFISDMKVVYHWTEKIQFNVKLNQLTNVFGLNNRTAMNLIFDQMSADNIDAILSNYSFVNQGLSSEKKLAMIYSSLLAGAFFIIWLSSQKHSVFEPLHFDSLVEDESLVSLLDAFNAQSISYLKASSTLFSSLKISPIHRLLNLIAPWINPWLDVLPPLTTETASAEGTLVAINAMIQLIPDIVNDVHRTVDEATATFSTFRATQKQQENNFLAKLTNSTTNAEARLKAIILQTKRDGERIHQSLTRSRDSINDQLRQASQTGETSIINQATTSVNQLVRRAAEIQKSINTLHNSAIANINQTLVKVDESMKQYTNEFSQMYQDEREQLNKQRNSIQITIDRFDERSSRLTKKLAEMEQFQRRLHKVEDESMVEYKANCQRLEKEYETERFHNIFRHKQELSDHMISLKRSIKNHVDKALREIIIDQVRLHFNSKFEDHVKDVICDQMVDALTTDALNDINKTARQATRKLNEKYDEVSKAIDTSQTAVILAQKNDESTSRLMAQVRLLTNRVKELEIAGRH